MPQYDNLVDAICQNDAKEVARILAETPDQKSRKALMDIAISVAYEDPNDPPVETIDVPLIVHAVDSGYLGVVEQLTKERLPDGRALIDLEARSSRHDTALLTAAYNACVRGCEDSWKIMNVLLSAGANINAQSRSGRSMLHYVTESKTLSAPRALLAAKSLLHQKADMHLRNKEGKNPAEIARYPVVAQYLLRQGAALRPANIALSSTVSPEKSTAIFEKKNISNIVRTLSQSDYSARKILHRLSILQQTQEKDRVSYILSEVEKSPDGKPTIVKGTFIADENNVFFILLFSFLESDARFELAIKFINDVQILCKLNGFFSSAPDGAICISEHLRSKHLAFFKGHFTDTQLCKIVDFALKGDHPSDYRERISKKASLLALLPHNKIVEYARQISSEEPYLVSTLTYVLPHMPADLRQDLIHQCVIVRLEEIARVSVHLSREEARSLLLPRLNDPTSFAAYDVFRFFNLGAIINHLTVSEMIVLIHKAKNYVQDSLMNSLAKMNLYQDSLSYFDNVRRSTDVLSDILIYLNQHCGYEQARNYFAQILEAAPSKIRTFLREAYSFHLIGGDAITHVATVANSKHSPASITFFGDTEGPMSKMLEFLSSRDMSTFSRTSKYFHAKIQPEILRCAVNRIEKLAVSERFQKRCHDVKDPAPDKKEDIPVNVDDKTIPADTALRLNNALSTMPLSRYLRGTLNVIEKSSFARLPDDFDSHIELPEPLFPLHPAIKCRMSPDSKNLHKNIYEALSQRFSFDNKGDYLNPTQCHKQIPQLIEKCVDINLPNRHDMTPLGFAILHASPHIVQLLLQRRELKINIADTHGLTALMYAAYRGHAGIARQLLQHPNIDAGMICHHSHLGRLLDGETAFLCAVRLGHTEVVQVFLEQGDVISLAESACALEVAKQNNHAELVRLLSCYEDNEPDISHHRATTPRMG